MNIPKKYYPIFKRLAYGLTVLGALLLTFFAIVFVPYVGGLILTLIIILVALMLAFVIGDAFVDDGEGW